MYFKAGYENAWSQRSTKVVSDMIQDPFWPSKQSSDASNDAILFDCGIGFIRRSADGGQNWTDITPASNPPNDAGDSPAPSVLSLDFIQGDANWTYTDEFVFIARWKNMSDVWRSWLAYTDDNGTTWTWKYIGGTGGGSGVTFQEAIGFYDTGVGPKLSSWDGALGWDSLNYQSRGNCVLSATKAIHIATQCNSDPPYTDIVAFIITIDSNGAITSVTGPTTILATTDSSQNRWSAIARISDTKFIVGYVDYEYLPAPPWTVWFPLRAKICDLVGGTSISVGSAIDIVGTSENQPIGEFDIVVLDSTTVAFPMVYGSAVASDEMAVKILYGIAGQTGSVGSIQQLGDGNIYFYVRGTAMDSTRFLVHMCQGDVNEGNGVVVGVRHTGSGTCSFGTPDFFDELLPAEKGSWQIRGAFGIKLTDTKWVVTYWRSPSSAGYTKRVGIFTPATLAVSVTGALHASEDDQSIARLADDEFVVVAEDPSAPGNAAIRVRRYTVSGSTISTNGGWVTYSYSGFTKAMYLWHAEHLSPIPGTNMFLSSSTINDIDVDWGASGITDCDNLCRAFTFEAPTGLSESIKGLGVSVGKGAGARVYVTGWDGTNLYLIDYDLPALTLFDSYSLGLATTANYAYPFAGIGDDDWVVVYGLMNDPYTLGIPTYVIESDDGGLTASLVPVDGTWSTGGCGALWMEYDGMMYAIRNLGSSSKLYYGNAVVELNLMSTLPFAAGVNPHGIKIDPYSLAVYAAADTAQSIMIAKSFPLYDKWIDMTYDHGAAGKINSLELL